MDDQAVANKSVTEKIDQYLTFMLANEEYGVPILCIVEIRGWEKPTPIPSVPDFVKGVINLRGNIVPVIDLRERFGLGLLEYTPKTVVIVVQVVLNNHRRIIGLIADAVSDVYSVLEKNIQAKPEVCEKISLDYIKGLVNISNNDAESKLIILLDVDRILSFDDLNKLSAKA